MERRSGSNEASWRLALHPSGFFNLEDISALPSKLGCPDVRGTILSISDDDSSDNNSCYLPLNKYLFTRHTINRSF